MIPEHETIEQLMDEPDGRPVEQLLAVLALRSPEEVTRFVNGLWRAGNVALASSRADPIADWRSAELLRAIAPHTPTCAQAAERGIISVFPTV